MKKTIKYTISEKEVERIGESLFNGACHAIGKTLTWLLLGFLIFWLVACQFGWFTDNSDRDGYHRSGMSVHVDALTGVNYFSCGSSLCVRVDENGKPIVTK